MALADAIGGVVSGLLGKGPVSAPDLSALFSMIDNAGEEQRNLINALPDSLKAQYDAYKASNASTASTLQSAITGNNQTLMDQTKANYGPNSQAVQASEDAAKTAIYANVPGQQAAIRQALAATGGFGRGTAAKQLAAPVLQAGQQFGQQVANISADQLQKEQSAVQSAISTINSIDDQTANTMFGMSRDQALQLLTNGRQDLQQQLASLVNQSQSQLNAKLGVEGANIENQYNQNVAQNAADNNKINSWVNLGTTAAAGAPGFLAGLNATPGTGFSPATMSTNGNYNYDKVMAL